MMTQVQILNETVCISHSAHALEKGIGCLDIYGTQVTVNISTNNNVLFFVSDLKIVYYNNY